MRLQGVVGTALGEFNGALVAIEPKSGEVLALVSRPSYDPNLLIDGIIHGDVDGGIRYAHVRTRAGR
jgi:cell division protein FtsI/penicillin-binding protein 2